MNLADSLEILIQKLYIPDQTSTWSEYYDEAASRPDYLSAKQKIVSRWLDQLKPATTADFGANTGEFSRLAAEYGRVIASDFDPFCVERLYNEIKASKIQRIHPFILDLSKPSPAIGVNNIERASFSERIYADTAFALALIHHLSIGKNIPFDSMAEFFKNICDHLIIEFVPKMDEKIQLMLSNKKDHYTDYSEDKFVNAFQKNFKILEKTPVGSSGRILYLMKKHER